MPRRSSWAGRARVSRPSGADAAGLVFDAIEQARAESVDVLLVDTAGRLQNRKELMDELAKIVEETTGKKGPARDLKLFVRIAVRPKNSAATPFEASASGRA